MRNGVPVLNEGVLLSEWIFPGSRFLSNNSTRIGCVKSAHQKNCCAFKHRYLLYFPFLGSRDDLMATYLVEHSHSNETCPAQSPDNAKMMEGLVLGEKRLEECGVKIVEDAKVRGEHRLLIFVEAPARENVEKYAEPLATVGPTKILDLTTCGAFLDEVLQGTTKGCT